jgi:hypothetical protein
MPTFPLTDFAPAPRDDGVAFTAARIEQASSPEGLWVVVDTRALSPLDTDPAHPMLREFVVELDLSLWTRVVFLAPGGIEQPTDPLPPEDATPGLRPSVSEVASRVPRRTKENMTGGREVGTFTSKTSPTAEQVEDHITDAVDEVTGKIGTPTAGSKLERRARGAISLYAAMLIELTYFPEQVQTNRSPFTALERLYNSRIGSLIADAEQGDDDDGGGGGMGGDGSPANASWAFPEDAGGLVGWQTRW